jgi:uncharacterized protein (TIGR02466 family)
MFLQPVFINFLGIDYLTDVDNNALQKYCIKQHSLKGADQNIESTMLDINAPELKTLVDSINSRLIKIHELVKLKESYTIAFEKAWCNIDNNINIDSPHCHPLSAFSIVYYVSGEEDSGSIQFMNPNPGMMNSQIGQGKCIQEFDEFNSNAWTINPESGKLLIFPSWLIHFVHQNKSNNRRISIAFDTEIILKGN